MNKTIETIVSNVVANNEINREMLLTLLDKYISEEKLLHAVSLLTSLEEVPEVPEHSKVKVSYKGEEWETATKSAFNPFTERVRYYVIRFENMWFANPEDAKKFSETGSYYSMNRSEEQDEKHPYGGCYARKNFDEISLAEWMEHA